RYFHLYFNPSKQAAEREQLEQCGYFCIITSTEMTASQALIHYKGRDISEKLFSTDKSFIGSKSNRVHSSESLSA
ncbi:MAG: transposase, partial [Clostridia bacterium]|nr:transposase [Clostridia bacterium]